MTYYRLIAKMDNPFVPGIMVKHTTTIFTSHELAIKWSNRFGNKIRKALKVPDNYPIQFSTESYEVIDYDPPQDN